MTGAANENYPPGHPRHVPEAWPLLLSRDQLCAYLGCSPETLVKVCPVQPRDMGANLIRYFRPEVDGWAAGLPPRLTALHKRPGDGEDAGPAPQPAADTADGTGENRSASAVERARERASGGARCPKKVA